MQRYVTSGERVTAGQELFSVDSKDAEEQAAAARSSLDAAGASLKLAQSTLARYEKLHAANAISDLAMDQTRNSYDLALTQYRSAEAALSRAENNLGFTTLVADRDGIVGTTLYEVGQVVAAGTPVRRSLRSSTTPSWTCIFLLQKNSTGSTRSACPAK